MVERMGGVFSFDLVEPPITDPLHTSRLSATHDKTPPILVSVYNIPSSHCKRIQRNAS